VVEIVPNDIDDLTEGMSISVRNAFLRNLRAAFNFAIRKGWCRENPINRIEMQSLRPRRLLLTNRQVADLLRATRLGGFDLLPYQLFCLFAGVRPEEVARMTWTNVNLRDKFIKIPDEESKTGVRRIVEIEPLLAAWLKYYIKRGGMTTGPVVPHYNLRNRLRALRRDAGIKTWPQDAPRRCYASNWLAAKHDVNKLNNMMGHTTPDMLFRHYHRAVTPAEAREFWGLKPPKTLER
jgi:integrase